MNFIGTTSGADPIIISAAYAASISRSIVPSRRPCPSLGQEVWRTLDDDADESEALRIERELRRARSAA